MKWLDKLEKKLGNYYIPNLMKIIIYGNAMVFIAANFIDKSGRLLDFLLLKPELVLEGQVWRLFSFMFVTPMSLVFAIFVLYFYYIAGTSIERELGEFKFNVYYFIGVIVTIAVSFITNTESSATVMNLSLFLAWAKLCPNEQILLFFVVPIKLKWMGYLNWGIIIISTIMAIVLYRSIGMVLLSIVPAINYLLFFGKYNYNEVKQRSNSVIRMKTYKKKMEKNKKNYVHKCEVCGITNVDDPDMEFRYCSKCEGKHCYCEKHIMNHEHKKETE